MTNKTLSEASVLIRLVEKEYPREETTPPGMRTVSRVVQYVSKDGFVLSERYADSSDLKFFEKFGKNE